jgi:phosphoribosylaminoimidazole-succinocarboxamide synthase
MTGSNSISNTRINDLQLVHRGKVRDVYQVDDNRYLLVATDRISAFDCISPTPISQKGEILTQLSAFWFKRFSHFIEHHLITANFDEMPDVIKQYDELRGRSTLVRKTKVFPVECVVRGYLAGSGWKDYQKNGEVCGHILPENLRESDRLPSPIFTPATKASTGHDENISEAEFAKILGAETAEKLRTKSLKLYSEACEYALTRGIIIADTKFEFGLDSDGNILLIDEILTPDSSRFWDVKMYEAGKSQASFDKQFVRDYLETLDWDKQPPAPILPNEVVERTREKYLQAYKLLTGNNL